MRETRCAVVGSHIRAVVPRVVRAATLSGGSSSRRSREKFRPHAARSCHFSPPFLPSPIPLPPPPAPLPPACPTVFARRTALRRVCMCDRLRTLCDRVAIFPCNRRGSSPGTGSSASSTFIIAVAAVRESSVVGVVRRKAPELRRRRRRRRKLDTTTERAREGDQQRIRLTRDGGPRQNVSDFSSLLSLRYLHRERRTLCERKHANAVRCDLN